MMPSSGTPQSATALSAAGQQHAASTASSSAASGHEQQPLELQLDYWPIIRAGDKLPSKTQTEQSKNSIKSAFRNLQVNGGAFWGVCVALY